MNEKFLHIISFDTPSPPNYGGVIDVYYKIKYLYQSGFKVILHCFNYNERIVSDQLKSYCYKIYTYTRYNSLIKQFSFLPYTVYSRKNKILLQNLLQDNYPILFETLHCAYYINHRALQNRKKILRLSNIEHHYYYHLFINEKKVWKKLYFLTESIKLYFFEKKAFHYSDYILPVTTTDSTYVSKYYNNKKTKTIPSFHASQNVNITSGKGDYILYHGNLSVAENYGAVEYLIKNIFSKISFPIIIAGKNPPAFLNNMIKNLPHIKIVSNPSENEMQSLIQNAHINLLYTNQPTGLKLKLINTLFLSRFIICNKEMLVGTDIVGNSSICICQTDSEIIKNIHRLININFENQESTDREKSIISFDNTKNLETLLSFTLLQ